MSASPSIPASFHGSWLSWPLACLALRASCPFTKWVGCPAANLAVLPDLPGLFCLSCCDCFSLYLSLPNLCHTISPVGCLPHSSFIPLWTRVLPCPSSFPYCLFGIVPSFPLSCLSSLHLVYPLSSFSSLLYLSFCPSFPTFLPTIISGLSSPSG